MRVTSSFAVGHGSYKRPSKYDWSRIILLIKRSGLSYEEIAGYLEVDASTVRKWVSRNQCPRYDEGVWLIESFQTLVSNQVPLMKGGRHDMTISSETRGGEREAALSVRYQGFSRSGSPL